MAKKIDLQAIVSENYAALYRFGLALTKNESEAADLVQETFLILAKHQEQIREPERIKCWLFTTLRRQFLHTHTGPCSGHWNSMATGRGQQLGAVRLGRPMA